VGKCRGCGAEIRWVKLEPGKPHPVDPKAVSVILLDEGRFPTAEDAARALTVEGGNPRGRVVRAYISHFATCPKAEQFRRPKNEEDRP
jgi:hypothetical protein